MIEHTYWVSESGSDSLIVILYSTVLFVVLLCLLCLFCCCFSLFFCGFVFSVKTESVYLISVNCSSSDCSGFPPRFRMPCGPAASGGVFSGGFSHQHQAHYYRVLSIAHVVFAIRWKVRRKKKTGFSATRRRERHTDIWRMHDGGHSVPSNSNHNHTQPHT